LVSLIGGRYHIIPQLAVKNEVDYIVSLTGFAIIT